MDKLLSCPFCLRGEGAILSRRSGFFSIFYVVCNDCHAIGDVSTDMEVACSLWNTKSANVVESFIKLNAEDRALVERMNESE